MALARLAAVSRLLALLAALGLAGCGSGGGGLGAPGERVGRAAPAAEGEAGAAPEARPRSASEQVQGDRAHPEILTAYGGAAEGKAAEYVRSLGRKLAAVSEQPDAPWTFTLLDSPVVNAFAIPGGYVYVTRGLMALADDEAELAGVIGHEIAHVTASHSAARQTRSTIAQIGQMAAVLGAAVAGLDAGVVDAIGQAGAALGQGAVASYSRSQELEADKLGVVYLARAGYDPQAQADFLASLQAQSALQADLAGAAYDANRVDFFATHPATAERVREAVRAADASGAAGSERRRDAFLRAVDGLTYGDSAAQGFVRGRRFVHPELRFAFEAPQGFEIMNSAEAVAMRGPGGVIVFDGGADPGGSLERYIAQGWAPAIAQEAQVGQLQGLESLRIGGLDAAGAWLPVRTRAGVRAGRLTVIRAGGGRVYRFFALANPDSAAAMRAAEAAPQSFRRLSAAEAARIRPYRVTVRTVRPGDTVESLAALTPFDRAKVERFRVLNDLDPGERLAPGRRVKLVVE